VKKLDAILAPRRVVPQFYSVTEVAAIFGLSSMTVYRAIAAGEFPAVKIRGSLIVPARAVEAMIEGATEHATMVDAASWVDDTPAGWSDVFQQQFEPVQLGWSEPSARC
jgi:excisionase family DNA binding protein